MSDIFDQVTEQAPRGDIFDRVASESVSADGDVFDQVAAAPLLEPSGDPGFVDTLKELPGATLEVLKGAGKDVFIDAPKEIPKGLARGVQQIEGAVGNLIEMGGDYLKAQERQWKSIFNESPIGQRVLEKRREKYIAENGELPAAAITETKPTAGQKVSDFGRDVSDFWNEAASTGWEARSKEIYEGTFKENPSFARLVGGASESAPTMLAALALSAGGAPNAGAILLAGSEALPIYTEAKNLGVSEGDAFSYALLSGIGTAALERVGLDAITGKIPAVDALIAKMGKSWAAGAMVNFGTEGTQEALQEIYQNAVALGYDGERDLLDGALEAGLIGGLMGGGMGASRQIFKGFMEKQAQNKPEESEQPVTDAPVDRNPVIATADVSDQGPIDVALTERVLEQEEQPAPSQDEFEAQIQEIYKEQAKVEREWIEIENKDSRKAKKLWNNLTELEQKSRALVDQKVAANKQPISTPKQPGAEPQNTLPDIPGNPERGALVGKNEAGEALYEREDGLVYRIHAGKPAFGGDLALAKKEVVVPAKEGGAAKVETPVEVIREVKEEMVSPDNPRPAKEIKSDIIEQLEGSLENRSAEKTGVVEQIEFSIPGDGTFKIWNTDQNIRDLITRAKRLTSKNYKVGDRNSSDVSPRDKNPSRSLRYKKWLEKTYTKENYGDLLDDLKPRVEAALASADANRDVPRDVSNRLVRQIKAIQKHDLAMQQKHGAILPEEAAPVRGDIFDRVAEEHRGRVPNVDVARKSGIPSGMDRNNATGRKTDSSAEELAARSAELVATLKDKGLIDSVLTGRFVLNKPIPKVPFYRGDDVNQEGAGTALYGLGRYTTTNKKYAKQFARETGTVVEVDPADIPNNPIRFETDLDFRNWLDYSIQKPLGLRNREFGAIHQDLGRVIRALGFDGLMVGTGRDVESVKYPETLDSFEQSPGLDAGEIEHRGTSQIPDSDSAPRTTVPDWVLKQAETPRGRKLVRDIGRGDGRKASLGTVVEMVNDAVGLQMRRSTGQTSRRHPAFYRHQGHVAYTRNTQSQINFHEAGHGLKELVESRSPAFFARYGDDLIELTKRPGSMASAENVHEGVAEWLRLRIVNPSAVESMAVTRDLEAELARTMPETGQSLRDASRVMQSFYNRPAAERWSMVANAPRRLSASDVKDFVVGIGGQVTDLLSTGAPLSRLDREVFKAIVKDRSSAKLSLKAALNRARGVRRQTTEPLLAAHNMVLQIGQEVQKAISGTGKDRGIRVIVEANNDNYVSFFPKTWREVVKAVPSGKWNQFQEAGWAKEALNRWMQDGLEYPGQLDGVTPDDLRNVVAQAEKEIPRFNEHVQTVQSFFDAVLDLKEFGGLKGDGEVEKMRRRGDYWPLPRVVESIPNAARQAGNINAGDYQAKGSGEAIKGLSEVAEERVRDAMTAYYWNRLGLKMADGLRKTANDASLPWLAREVAGRVMQPLKMQQKIAATVSREEALDWIIPSLNEQKMEELGRPLQDEEMIRSEDINLSWNFKDVWRPTSPKDFNVVSFLRDGDRKFYQLHDPSMFKLFASSDQAGKVSQAVAWAFGPTMQNWKRNITQSLPFSMNNAMGDLINQMMLNKDVVGFFPGGATTLGAVNRFTKKYPQVMQEGLLLSRVEPGSVELVNRVKHGAVWQFLTDGWYVSQAKNPAARFALTALQPSNWLFPVWKAGDLVNFVTAGRFVAPRIEGATREGAAVAAKLAGESDEAANYAYWRVTGTFNEHSGVADLAQMMRMPGFFNPMLQAVRGAGKVLTDPDPAVSGAAWAKLLIEVPAMFAGAAYVAFLFMDDDEKKRERERPVDDRMSYHQVNGFKIRFPYGPEGAMGSLIYNGVMDELLGLPREQAGKKSRLALNRIGGMGSPLEFMGPQIKALTEAKMNYSTFRQRHIVSPWMSGLPESEQYSLHTPRFYKALGKWADYSPDKLQYLVQNGLNRQVDELARLLDRMDRNEALLEKADLPFVGRMFVRSPNGFSSRSGQKFSDLEDKLKALDVRLNNSGYSGLKNGDAVPASRQGAALDVQLRQLESLRLGTRVMRKYARLVRFSEISENQVQADNIRQAMMVYAQSVLAHNPEATQRIEFALDALDQMPTMAPADKAGDYLRR